MLSLADRARLESIRQRLARKRSHGSGIGSMATLLTANYGAMVEAMQRVGKQLMAVGQSMGEINEPIADQPLIVKAQPHE